MSHAGLQGGQEDGSRNSGYLVMLSAADPCAGRLASCCIFGAVFGVVRRLSRPCRSLQAVP
jgi:hypothetical protein